MELEKIKATLIPEGDFHEVVKFPNGYGVSILRNAYSYGGRQGLFEVAVLDSTGDICYTTPVTGDVLGWLTVDEVLTTMKAVLDLPKAICNNSSKSVE